MVSRLHREHESWERLACLQSGRHELKPVRELGCSYYVPQEAAETVEALSEAGRELEHCRIVVILDTLDNPSASDQARYKICMYPSRF